MPWNTESAARCSRKPPVACNALVALACLALASCGGGPGPAHPDLVVEDPAASDPRPAAGTGFTFSATVRNAGRGNAAATTLRVYRSDDETITPSDEQVGAAAVPELAASESKVVSVELRAPSKSGAHYYAACVDPVAGESDTVTDCSAAVRVVVQVQNLEPASPQPDLVLEDPAVSDDSPVAGASFSFSATVRNAGDGDAAATTLRVYRSDDETITPSDEQVGAAAVPELAASESKVVSVELRAPSKSGAHYYGACVHAAAEESDTTNNCSAAVTVSVQGPQAPVSGPPRPDLVVYRVWVRPSSPGIGGLFVLGADVRNRGGATSRRTTLRFYRSTDATITRSDTQLATKAMWFNRGKWEAYLREWVKAPSSKGKYHYGACVDEVPGESDTANNCSAALTVDVSHYIPDIWVISWTQIGPLAIGTSLSLPKTVYNLGSPSAATTLRLILLPDRKSAPSAGTQVGEVAVPALEAGASSTRSVKFRTPATPGWYHYAWCADPVPGESDTTNNCSPATSIEFR